jgi:hypothetical protein
MPRITIPINDIDFDEKHLDDVTATFCESARRGGRYDDEQSESANAKLEINHLVQNGLRQRVHAYREQKQVIEDVDFGGVGE